MTSELTKDIREQIVDTYVRTFDIEEVGRIAIGEKGKDVDSAIARIRGIEILKDVGLNEAIDKAILEKKITPDNIKIEAYKMSHTDSDGRVKVKALELIGKWIKLEEPAVENHWNLTMTWQSVVEQAHAKKRNEEQAIAEEHKAEEIPSAESDKL